jgi:hypothetical protein
MSTRFNVAAGTLLAIRGPGAVATSEVVDVTDVVLLEVAAGAPPLSGDLPQAASKIAMAATRIPHPLNFIPPS